MSAFDLIAAISRENSKVGYAELMLAIDLTVTYLPQSPNLRTQVYPVIGELTGKSAVAVSRNIARAVESCWYYGSRSAIDSMIGCTMQQRPSAKQFIVYCAYFLKYSKPYHRKVLTTGMPLPF